MQAERTDSGGPLPAGRLSIWLTQMEDALHGRADATVPCDGCTACCTSSQFVHIAPDETETLARIPRELQFDAPGRPRGHVVLGYDERGHCPMLVDGACSIYEHRPRTCRTYDCRIFSATGLEPPDHPAIVARIRRWRFASPAEDERCREEALMRAAAFLASHELRGVPSDAGARAALAVELHDLFLMADAETGRLGVVDPPAEVVIAEIAGIRRRTGDPAASRP